MHSRFLPWAGCTISDLKLTHSSAQGEGPPARAPGKSAGAEPTQCFKQQLQHPGCYSLIQVTLYCQKLRHFQYSHTTESTSSLPGVGLETAQCLTLGSYTCLQHPAVTSQLQTLHSWNQAHIWTLQACIFRMNSELGHLSTQGCWLVWFSRAALWPRAGSVTEYGHCPESQRGKSQHRSSSSSPWGAPVQQMRLILTACCTFLLQLSL